MIAISTRPYKCRFPGCGKTFIHKQHFKRHEQHAHSPPKYHCSIPGCNQIFRYKDSLKDHLKYVHYFDESQRLPCPYPGCNQSFKDRKDLRKHIRYLHSDTPRHKCPYPNCNRTYQRKSGLNEHIRFVHQGLRPHVCEKCGKPFRQVQSLRYHQEHNLCGSTGRRRNQSKIMTDHNYAVDQLNHFLKDTKNPRSLSTEHALPNQKRPDVLAHCSNNRHVGFDITIGRASPANLRNQITEKYDRNYEKFCDKVYIVVISNIKKTRQTIQECNIHPTKPKKTRVVHWNAIIQDHPKYYPIFKQIEDETDL